MADIKRLLNKKGWTGRELGIIEITNMATVFRQQITGQPREPLIEANQLQHMINGITDSTQARIYNGYISIHEWLSLYYNISQTQVQQAQLRFKTLSTYITQAMLAEDIYSYIESLPVIMTEKQYKEAVDKGRELWLKEEDGTDRGDSVLPLIYRAMEYYIKLLADEPKKENPLKPIRKKYLSAPIESKLILSRYNEAADKGYYSLEDGRRSDEMTDEEWQAAITTPKMKDTLAKMDAEGKLGVGHFSHTAAEMAEHRLIKKAKLVYSGSTNLEADEAQQQEDYEAGLAVPAIWHTYTEPPKDLTKWEVLEDACTLYMIYETALSGADGDYIAEAKDFVAEFKEAVDAIIKDIDGKFFKGEAGLAELPIEKWESTVFDWTQLYEKDYYGFRADTDKDDIIFDGNWRAMFNGVAILKPSSALRKTRGIDEDGNYTPPDVRQSFINYSLQSFFPEADTYADNVEEVERGRKALLESYYFLKGYNIAIDLIASHFDLPAIDIFKANVEHIEGQIEAINALVPLLYHRINDIQYEDEELKQRKLQVLKDVFTEIDYKSVAQPEENIEQVQELFKDFVAFKDSNIADLLFYLPEDDGEGDECE